MHDVLDLIRLTLLRGWRWLVWSPRRVLGVLAVVVGLGIAYSTFVAGPPTGPQAEGPDTSDLPAGWQDWPRVTAAPAGESAKPSPAPSPSSPVPSGPGSGSSAPTPEQEREVSTLARTFVEAYIADLPPRRWSSALRPLVTPALSGALDSVDPRNVPGKTVQRVRVLAADEFKGEAEVATDAGTYRVGVQFQPDPYLPRSRQQPWKVVKVTPPSPAGGR